MTIMQRFLIGFGLLAIGSCGAPEPRGANTASLQVMQKAPLLHARYLCGVDPSKVDSMAWTSSDSSWIECRAGGDTMFSIRHDTVVYIEHSVYAPPAPISMSMLDYWNSMLRPVWSKHFGRPPDMIAARQLGDSLFEAIWNVVNAFRSVVQITKASGGFAVKIYSLDCRKNGGQRQPWGCRSD